MKSSQLHKHIKIIASTLFLIVSFNSVQAKRAPRTPNYIHDPSHWLLELPLWIPGFRGQLAYGGVDFFSGNDEAKEHERLSSKLGLEFYFTGRAMYRKNKFWFQLDAFSGTVSNTFKYTTLIGNNTKNLAKLTAQGTIPRLTIGYSVYTHRRGSLFKFEVIPYLGVRYNHIRISSDLLNNGNLLDVNPNWFEPVLGIYLPVSYKRFQLILQGDMGGINRKKTWIINSHLRYRVSKLIDVSMGWTALNIHHNRQYKNEDLALNIRLMGPNVGIGFKF